MDILISVIINTSWTDLYQLLRCLEIFLACYCSNWDVLICFCSYDKTLFYFYCFHSYDIAFIPYAACHAYVTLISFLMMPAMLMWYCSSLTYVHQHYNYLLEILMWIFSLFSSFSLLKEHHACQNATNKGASYIGPINQTSTSHRCQRWDYKFTKAINVSRQVPIALDFTGFRPVDFNMSCPNETIISFNGSEFFELGTYSFEDLMNNLTVLYRTEYFTEYVTDENRTFYYSEYGDGAWGGMLEGSHCRNPGELRDSAWCFLRDEDVNTTGLEWEYCEVANCTGEFCVSFIIQCALGVTSFLLYICVSYINNKIYFQLFRLYYSPLLCMLVIWFSDLFLVPICQHHTYMSLAFQS